MRRLLLDANVSPQTSGFLRAEFGFDAVDLTSLGLTHLDDTEVIDLARSEQRIVVTEDLDFGRLYYHYNHGGIGVIVWRVRPQSAVAANRALKRFFSDPATRSLPLERAIVVIDNRRIRVITEP
jgi:hypothetical protein